MQEHTGRAAHQSISVDSLLEDCLNGLWARTDNPRHFFDCLFFPSAHHCSAQGPVHDPQHGRLLCVSVVGNGNRCAIQHWNVQCARHIGELGLHTLDTSEIAVPLRLSYLFNEAEHPLVEPVIQPYGTLAGDTRTNITV